MHLSLIRRPLWTVSIEKIACSRFIWFFALRAYAPSAVRLLTIIDNRNHIKQLKVWNTPADSHTHTHTRNNISNSKIGFPFVHLQNEFKSFGMPTNQSAEKITHVIYTVRAVAQILFSLSPILSVHQIFSSFILGAFVLAPLALRSAPFWLSGVLRFYLCSLIQFIRCYYCWCGVGYCLPLVIFIFIVLLTDFRGILSAMVSRRSYELNRGQRYGAEDGRREMDMGCVAKCWRCTRRGNLHVTQWSRQWVRAAKVTRSRFRVHNFLAAAIIIVCVLLIRGWKDKKPAIGEWA